MLKETMVESVVWCVIKFLVVTWNNITDIMNNKLLIRHLSIQLLIVCKKIWVIMLHKFMWSFMRSLWIFFFFHPLFYLFSLSRHLYFIVKEFGSFLLRISKMFSAATWLFQFLEKLCPRLEPPENSDIFCSHQNTYGSECTVTCHQAYELVGEKTQICQNNQTWSGEEQLCSGKCIFYIMAETFLSYIQRAL